MHAQSDAIARRLTAIFVGLFGVLVIVSPLAIAVVWGEEYVGAADVLPVLLVAVMLTSIALGAATTLQSTRVRGPRAVALVNLAGLVVSLLAWPFLAPRCGTIGVALGYLVGSGLASLAHARPPCGGSSGTTGGPRRPSSSAAPPSSSPSPSPDPRRRGPPGARPSSARPWSSRVVWLALNRREVRRALGTLRGRGTTPAST